MAWALFVTPASLFFLNGWGGGGRVGGGVIIRRDYRGELLEDVLLRKKRFCKYHVIENVCHKEKRLKTKVRKVWIKSHTSHEPNM